jgi:MtN3 and saliva related transmembrane protein
MIPKTFFDPYKNDINNLTSKDKNMSPKFMKFYEKYMTVVGTVGNFMFYVQAHKIFTCKSAASVSLPAFTISAVALSSWLLYGILIKNTPIIIANIVGFIGALLVLVAIILH